MYTNITFNLNNVAQEQKSL